MSIYSGVTWRVKHVDTYIVRSELDFCRLIKEFRVKKLLELFRHCALYHISLCIYDESGGREKTPLPFKKIAREDKEQITIE